MDKWININNQIPDKEHIVLATDNDGEYMVGYIFKSEHNGFFACEYGGEFLCNITHWMELPKVIEE